MRKDAVILIVDSDESLTGKLAAAFENRGATVITARSFLEAQKHIQKKNLDLVLCATHLEKGNDGIAVLTAVREKNPSIPVILTSTTADIEACKEAIKLGAFDYLVKPLDIDELTRVVQQAVPIIPVVRGSEDFTFSGVVSRSPVMQAVYRKLRRISPTDLPILIEGESGTGKELTAKAIHVNSADKTACRRVWN